MLTAIAYGVTASSALVIGAVIGARWDLPRYLTAALLAFASGALISALAFELFAEAYELGGAARSGLGLLAGAAVFVVADSRLESRMGEHARSGGGSRSVGWALLAGVTLDGVPENVALGTSLAEGASVSLLVAIFASNLPEALVGATAMRETGQSNGRIVGIWTICAALLAVAVVAGDAIGAGLSPELLAITLGFAGGAVLASLADTLMPEAFKAGKPWIAFATAAGFFVSFVLAAGGG